MRNLEIKVKYTLLTTRYFSQISDIIDYGFSHPKVKSGMLNLIKDLKPYVKAFSYYPSELQIYNKIALALRNHNHQSMDEYSRIRTLMTNALNDHFVENNQLNLNLNK